MERRIIARGGEHDGKEAILGGGGEAASPGQPEDTYRFSGEVDGEGREVWIPQDEWRERGLTYSPVTGGVEAP